MKIIMINDSLCINSLYRGDFLDALRSNYKEVLFLPLFDKKLSNVIKLIFSIIRFDTLIISSNIRSNIFSLCFFWKKGVVILNGLGRNRNNKLFRVVLFILFYLNWRKLTVVQSYADYRYFKRYSCRNFQWIPGSGGREKRKGSTSTMISVQRDDKIELTCKSLLCLAVYMKQKIIIVGCSKNKLKVFPEFIAIGKVNSNDILLKGGIFVQPDGYGEGFPHTLADAIVSDMKIYISSKEYVRYGIRMLGGKKCKVFNGWYILKDLKSVSEKVNKEVIVMSYLNTIKVVLK
jgi:hypothetical protein